MLYILCSTRQYIVHNLFIVLTCVRVAQKKSLSRRTKDPFQIPASSVQCLNSGRGCTLSSWKKNSFAIGLEPIFSFHHTHTADSRIYEKKKPNSKIQISLRNVLNFNLFHCGVPHNWSQYHVRCDIVFFFTQIGSTQMQCTANRDPLNEGVHLCRS